MAKLSDRKTRLRFETDARFYERGKYRELMVEPTPHLLFVHLKGTKRRLPVSYQTVYEIACKIESNRVRAEKASLKALKFTKKKVGKK